jgi:hypothetical protein
LCKLLRAPLALGADVPQSFTLDGRLFSNPQGTTPLTDASIGVRLQVLDDDKLCILYEEQQTISTTASEGYFTVQVGSQVGSTKRSVLGDSGNDMTEVFSNMAPISGKAIADGMPLYRFARGRKTSLCAHYYFAVFAWWRRANSVPRFNDRFSAKCVDRGKSGIDSRSSKLQSSSSEQFGWCSFNSRKLRKSFCEHL